MPPPARRRLPATALVLAQRRKRGAAGRMTCGADRAGGERTVMAETGEAVEQFLRATEYVDSDASGVVAFGWRVAGATGDDVGRAVALYHEVRDGIVYTPYCDFQSRE